MKSRLLVLVAFVPLSAAPDLFQTPHCSDESADWEKSKREVSATDFEVFESLEPGMERKAVVDLVGNPTYLCGSGIRYDVYVLGDGKEVWIAYPYGKAAWAFLEDAEEPEGRLRLW